jgi:predicted ribosome quality control (RQC) complex YloA/Tae2 family protein
MQTALHIFSLAQELNDKIVGGVFSGTEFYKKEREAYLMFDAAGNKYALGLTYHPVGFGAFLISRNKIDIETSEKPWPFFQLAYGGVVQSVRQIDFDRIIQIDLAKDGQSYSIILEAMGPNGNFWLLSADSKILATLRHRKYDISLPYSPPTGLNKLNPFEMNKERLHQAMIKEIHQTIETALKKSITGLDEYLILEILHRAGLKEGLQMENLTDSDYGKISDIICEVADLFKNYDKAYQYNFRLKHLVYPFRLNVISQEAIKQKSLSLAIYRAIRSKKYIDDESSEREKVIEAVDRTVKKQEKKIIRIEQDLASSEKYDEYRRYAELLKINLSSLKKGMSKAVLIDIYQDESVELQIPLNPALNPSENADEYFKKYRKGKEALELLSRRLEIARQEFSAMRKMYDDIMGDFDAAKLRYNSEIATLLPSVHEKGEAPPRLPYKIFTLSTGVIIFIGRDGADNDRTTFDHAKPHELWFHAAQCPGSHVVMKFPNKDFQPSKAEILETAAIAAFHSKAKNSKTVPVIYAERRYVRKPRKAKPGLVTVEREKLVMVEPRL